MLKKNHFLTLFSFIVFSLFFLQSHQVIADKAAAHQSYTNSKYAYTVQYPEELKPQGESANGDGQKFSNKDQSISLLVYGGYNALDESLKTLFQNETKDKAISMSYKTIQKNYYVISGTKADKVFYKKVIQSKDIFKTLYLEYPSSVKKYWDQKVSTISKSFKSLE